MEFVKDMGISESENIKNIESNDDKNKIKDTKKFRIWRSCIYFFLFFFVKKYKKNKNRYKISNFIKLINKKIRKTIFTKYKISDGNWLGITGQPRLKLRFG